MEVDLFEDLLHGALAPIPLAELIKLQALTAAAGLAVGMQEGGIG